MREKMPRSIRVLCHAAGLALTLAIAGCGGGSSSSTSGLPSAKRLIELTDAEKGTFCDWAVEKYGGYGRTCNSDWAFMSYPNREACIADAPSSTNTPTCEDTVGQAEACVNAMGSCASYQDLKSSPVCLPVTNC
jgi:hypothetical protein